MTSPGLTGQPDDDRVDEVMQAATVAVMAAVATATVTWLAGDTVAATTQLATDVLKARTRMLRAMTPAIRGVIGRAATRATRQAHADLGSHATDPGVHDRFVTQAVTGLTGKATQVAYSLAQAAQRMLADAANTAQAAGHDEQTRLEAAQRSLDRTADRGGIPLVDDTGHRWNADTYMRYAVSAAVRDVEWGIHHAWLQRNGINLVYVSTNATACKLCLPWEGQVLSLDSSGTPGGTVNVPGNDGARISVPVAGSVSAARGSGLGHYACRHELRAFVAGLTVISDARPGQRETANEINRSVISQHIRHWRRRQAMSITPQRRRQARQKLAYWRSLATT